MPEELNRNYPRAIGVRVTEEQAARLEAMAEADRRPLAQMARLLLAEAMDARDEALEGEPT